MFCLKIKNFVELNYKIATMKKSLKYILSAAIALLYSGVILAEIPAGYYSGINGKSTSELKTALYNIIKNQSQTQTYSGLPKFFQRTDVYPNSNRWWEMYSNEIFYVPSFSGMNREHALPKSWWGGSDDVLAYTDLNHLYPSEMDANSAKSNYPLGVVTDGGSKFNNGVSKVGKGQNSGGAAFVFEPADEYKGDFARAYFYMVTCYQNLTWRYQYMCMNGTYPSMQQWAIDLLLKWHRQDPVSDKEINRNEQVYLIQANRNPFIDYPDLAEYIWGNKMGQSFTATTGGGSTGGTGDAVLITPPNKMALDFNQVAIGYKTSMSVQFRSEKMTQPLGLRIIGVNKSLFTISSSTVSATAANATSGTYITITYSPTIEGTHTARLVITMDPTDFPEEASRVIDLTGECLSVPTLSTLTATNATEVTSNSFVANWDAAPESDAVDYYVVTLKRYAEGTVETEEFSTENNSMLIEELEGVDYVTYSVQSERLGVRSAMSNVITVTPLSGIDNVVADEKALVVESYPGMIRFRCSEPHYNVVLFDMLGREVMTLEEISDGYELMLPKGVYVVTSESHSRPIKIVAR